MDQNRINKKTFQETRIKPPKVAHGEGGGTFLCVLCNWLLSIPYQSYCGDRACYKCLKSLAQTLKQNGRETIKCPGCGEDIIPDQFFPDKAAARELNALHVACPNEGCSWEGQYSDYEDHFNKCPQSRVKCTYEQCKEMVLRKNMEKHTMTCVFRPSRCEYCGAETTFIHLQGSEAGLWTHKHQLCMHHQQLKSGTVLAHTMATATMEDIARLQHTMKKLEDYYSDLARLVQTLQATNYNGVYSSKVPEMNRRRHAILGKEDETRTLATVSSQTINSREKLEQSFPIEDIVTLLLAKDILTQFEYEEIQSTPNRVEKNRKFLDFLSRKDEDVALEGTLIILSQPQYKSYRYLGGMLKELFHFQRSDGRLQQNQHAICDRHTDPAGCTSYNGVYIWKVPELTRRRRDAVLGKTISLYSAPFFTSCHGYKLCLRVYLNGDGSGQGTHISFFITLMKGEFDPLLPWPFKQTVSLSLLAQDGVSRDITQSLKPNEDSSSFQMPKCEMNVASGCPQFCSLAVLDNLSYARGDTIYLKGAVNTQGIEHII